MGSASTGGRAAAWSPPRASLASPGPGHQPALYCHVRGRQDAGAKASCYSDLFSPLPPFFPAERMLKP